MRESERSMSTSSTMRARAFDTVDSATAPPRSAMASLIALDALEFRLAEEHARNDRGGAAIGVLRRLRFRVSIRPTRTAKQEPSGHDGDSVSAQVDSACPLVGEPIEPSLVEIGNDDHRRETGGLAEALRLRESLVDCHWRASALELGDEVVRLVVPSESDPIVRARTAIARLPGDQLEFELGSPGRAEIPEELGDGVFGDGWLRSHDFQYIAVFRRRKTGHIWKTPYLGR